MTLNGYTLPRTPEGRSSLVPAPPWHYIGSFLVVDFWADPNRVAALLPPGLSPHPDPGRCAAVVADWQGLSETGSELLDPVRSQYREFYVVLNALLGAEQVTTCSFCWVDQDFALVRGWIQGFPKKLGSIWQTRTFGLDCRADPGIRPGAAYGGTCSASGRRLAEMTVTLESPSAKGSINSAPPIVNVRHFPQLAAGHQSEPAVHELVRARSRDRAISEVWEGAATLDFHPSPSEELDTLAPVRVGRGYRFTFAYTVDDLETVMPL